MENRTNLWLHVTLKQVRNSHNAGNPTALRNEIETLPESMNKAYESILERSKDKRLACKVLHIIAGAKIALPL